jgi:chemotaxis protein CheZ
MTAATPLLAVVDGGLASDEAGRPVTREDVAEIVADVISRMVRNPSTIEIRLYGELEELVRFIRSAKAEIAAIRPNEIRDDYITAAADELDAVVGATEEATGRILDAAEQVQVIAKGLAEPARSQLVELATGIFEASNFQDVTGQRITKVVKTLKHIETKIGELVTLLGEDIDGVARPAQAEPAELPAEELMNGPQLPGQGIDQSEIDRLLASFD